METLGYSHIATAGESSTVEPTFESVDWKRFSSLGMMGLISAVTILGSLSTTADSAAASCYSPCRGHYNGHGHGLRGRKYHRPHYRHASYRRHHRRHGHYLHRGSRGHRVAKLQHQLGLMGYFHHPRATGYFGYKTREAVKAFQRDVGLRADGIVGPRTGAALGIF